MSEENNQKELTFKEEIDLLWQSFREERELLKIKSAEADKRAAEFDKRMKELQEEIGGISKSNGAMAEEIVYSSLEQEKTFCGIKFDEIDRNLKVKLKKLNLEGEFDVILQNCDTLALIETKYRVREKDVFKLYDKKVKDFRKLFPQFNDYSIILGIGGMSFEENSEDEAIKNGIGIIKIKGDKVEYYTDNIKIY